MEWISVKERLPEDNSIVVVYLSPEWNEWESAKFDGVNWISFNGEITPEHLVSHWAEVEPPKHQLPKDEWNLPKTKSNS